VRNGSDSFEDAFKQDWPSWGVLVSAELINGPPTRLWRLSRTTINNTIQSSIQQGKTHSSILADSLPIHFDSWRFLQLVINFVIVYEGLEWQMRNMPAIDSCTCPLNRNPVSFNCRVTGSPAPWLAASSSCSNCQQINTFLTALSLCFTKVRNYRSKDKL